MTAVIAIDVMGGDNAPGPEIEGIWQVAQSDPDLHFRLYGKETLIRESVGRFPGLSDRVDIVHCDQHITPEDKPSYALRRGRDSSMAKALEAVRDGKAQAAISAGNTGALMALSMYVLKRLEGIGRPAIAGILPTTSHPIVMLDLGANAVCDSQNLVEFAVMGQVFARQVLGRDRPRVALLNIGIEEAKGREEIRDAAAELKRMDLPIDFIGFIEAHDITAGRADVVVCDGFTGNVALKTAEGVVKMTTSRLKDAFLSSWVAKLGYLLSKGALSRFRSTLDPSLHNGAMFVGLNGIVVKSHGAATGEGFGTAVRLAAKLVRNRANERIIAEMHPDQSASAAISDGLVAASAVR